MYVRRTLTELGIVQTIIIKKKMNILGKTKISPPPPPSPPKLVIILISKIDYILNFTFLLLKGVKYKLKLFMEF